MSNGPSTKLTVRIDHVAGIRQLGLSGQPDLIAAAQAAINGGADGISARIYHDRRAIQDLDARALVRELRVPTTLIVSARADLLDLVSACRPAACCIAPESREDFTIGGGLDVRGMRERIVQSAAWLLDKGIVPLAFVDPDRVQLAASAEAGIQEICLNTGAYSFASSGHAVEARLSAIAAAAADAAALGLRVRAGSGLDHANASAVAAVADVAEIEVGHAIVAAAMTAGVAAAVAKLRESINGKRRA